MEIKVDPPVKPVNNPGPVAIFLILVYNLALLSVASYLVYYKDASAWLFVFAIIFGASWKNKEDIA